MRCLVTSAPLNRQQTRRRRREIRPQPAAHATPAHPYSDGLTEPGALVGSARESPRRTALPEAAIGWRWRRIARDLLPEPRLGGREQSSPPSSTKKSARLAETSVSA